MATFNPSATCESSPEHKTIRECYDKLVKTLETSYASIGDTLYSRGLISPDVKKRLRGAEQSDDDKARSILDSIETSIEQDPQVYHIFVDVLKEQGPWSNFIVAKLKNCFKLHSTTTTTSNSTTIRRSSERNTSTKVKMTIRQEIEVSHECVPELLEAFEKAKITIQYVDQV